MFANWKQMKFKWTQILARVFFAFLFKHRNETYDRSVDKKKWIYIRRDVHLLLLSSNKNENRDEIVFIGK